MQIDRVFFAQTIVKSAKKAYHITKTYWIQKHKLIDVKLM